MTARPSPEQIAEAAATVKEALTWFSLPGVPERDRAEAALDVLVAAAQQTDALVAISHIDWCIGYAIQSGQELLLANLRLARAALADDPLREELHGGSV